MPGWVEEWLGDRRAGSYNVAWRCWESRVQGRCSNEGRDKLWGRVYGEKRRREGGGRGDGDIRLVEEKDTIFCGLGRGVAASDIRAVCTLHFSTNDERHIPTNGLAWQTRTAGMGEEACLHVALRSRHDLHAAIGWCEASKRVVNGVYYEIIVYGIPCTNVGDDGRLARKAIGHSDYFQRC